MTGESFWGGVISIYDNGTQIVYNLGILSVDSQDLDVFSHLWQTLKSALMLTLSQDSMLLRHLIPGVKQSLISCWEPVWVELLHWRESWGFLLIIIIIIKFQLLLHIRIWFSSHVHSIPLSLLDSNPLKLWISVWWADSVYFLQQAEGFWHGVSMIRYPAS